MRNRLRYKQKDNHKNEMGIGLGFVEEAEFLQFISSLLWSLSDSNPLHK